MKYLAILDPILDALHDGRIFRRIFSIALKSVAALVVLGTLLTLVTVLGLAFGDFMPAEARIGVLLFTVVILAMASLQVNVLLYHARGVEQLPPTAVVLSSIMFSMVRMVGECFAILMCAFGIGGFFAGIFGAGSVISQTGFGAVPGMGLVGGTGSGAVLLVTALLLAFVGLTLAYFIAEQGTLLGDIAMSIRKLVPYSAGLAVTPAPMPIPASVLGTVPRTTPIPAPASPTPSPSLTVPAPVSPTPTASIPRPTPAPIAPMPPPLPPPPVARPLTPLPVARPATPPPVARPAAPPPSPASSPLPPPPVRATATAPAPESASRRCRNCNAFLGPEQLFCIECGTRAS